jgi:hydrogenase expression/formation protein HypC
VIIGGTSRVVSLALLDGEAVEPGSWVLIHLGYALERIEADEAQEALTALRLTEDRLSDDNEEPA